VIDLDPGTAEVPRSVLRSTVSPADVTGDADMASLWVFSDEADEPVNPNRVTYSGGRQSKRRRRDISRYTASVTPTRRSSSAPAYPCTLCRRGSDTPRRSSRWQPTRTVSRGPKSRRSPCS